MGAGPWTGNGDQAGQHRESRQKSAGGPGRAVQETAREEMLRGSVPASLTTNWELPAFLQSPTRLSHLVQIAEN